MIEEIVLLQDAENLLPVNNISGSLQVFADLLVTIADKLPAQQTRNIKQELFICNFHNSSISDHGSLSPTPDLQRWRRIVMCAPWNLQERQDP